MASVFVMYLLAAFLTGGAWIAAATLVAERSGSRLGGLIIGFPSTTVVSFVFIAISQSASVAVNATTIFPIVYGFTALMLAVYYIISYRYGFSSGLILSICLWLGLSLATVASGVDIAEASVGYLLLFAISIYLFSLVPGGRAGIRGNGGTASAHLVLRAAFSGAMVAVTVLASNVAGPVLGGALAAFPSSFIASIVILNEMNGPEFARSSAKPMMLSGMLTSVAYCFSVRLLYVPFGVVSGTIASFAIAIAVSVPAYYIIRRFG